MVVNVLSIYQLYNPTFKIVHVHHVQLFVGRLIIVNLKEYTNHFL